MVSINTNLSSLIVQQNLTKSTNGLNQAIERLTTGCKINHASDNAAGYSISQDMSSKLSSYHVAADNVAAGLDLVRTAQDTIALMQSRGERLMSLWTQSQNGTYGAQSLAAMNTEAAALIMEINRTYQNTEYNGIKLFETDIALEEGLKKAGSSGFIDESAAAWDGQTPGIKSGSNGFMENIETVTPDIIVTEASALYGAITNANNTVIGIEDANVLAEFAKIVNGDGYAAKNCSGKTIVLTDNIDLTSYCTEHTNGEGIGGWTAIGIYGSTFKGTFDGQGHKISGLYINTTDEYQGLFGYAKNGEIKNVALEGVNIKGGNCTGSLVGSLGENGKVTNSYAIGSVTGTGNNTGGLVARAYSEISNCYTSVVVYGAGSNTGGLVGNTFDYILNCYSIGVVEGNNYTGGLAGTALNVFNSYSKCSVTGNNNITGGLVGLLKDTGIITNCYATGYVTSSGYNTGGLVGNASGNISNSYATGDVDSQGKNVGGLIGSFTGNNINNCYSTGSVTGHVYVGGSVGRFDSNDTTEKTISNVVSYSKVFGDQAVGSFIGGIKAADSNMVDALTFSNCKCVDTSAELISGWYTAEAANTKSEYDFSTIFSNINLIDINYEDITMQVGITGDSSSRIDFNTSLKFDLNSILTNGIQSAGSYDIINNFMNNLSAKATELGAASNRLESALESISVNINNLTSSRSTIQDADIAKVSSQYIKNQILQQASATLLATANQTPAFTLQLIQGLAR